MKREPPLTSVETLLAEARWLRKFARSLVDEASAEDVVQETYAVAISLSPRGDGPLRPWLSTVLRNFVRIGARGSRRRAQNERRAAAEPIPPLPTPEELLLARQRQRLVGETIEALEEPYRTTLLLCYAEGLTPSEIARRQQVPAATVRARLRRGLGQARQRLDERHGGDRGRWSAILMPWLSQRAPGPTSSGSSPRNPPTQKEITPMKLIPTFTLIAAGAALVGGTTLTQTQGTAAVPHGQAPARPGSQLAQPPALRLPANAATIAAFVSTGMPALVSAAQQRDGSPSREEFIDECMARRQKLAACSEALADQHAREQPPGLPAQEVQRRHRGWSARYQRAAGATVDQLRAICTTAWEAGGQPGRPMPTRAQISQARACWEEIDCAAAITCAKEHYAEVKPPTAPDPAGDNAVHEEAQAAARPRALPGLAP